MGRLLDYGEARVIASLLTDLKDETGFADEEFVPGLIQAIVDIARTHKHEIQLMDEAADLLADGGVDD